MAERLLNSPDVDSAERLARTTAYQPFKAKQKRQHAIILLGPRKERLSGVQPAMVSATIPLPLPRLYFDIIIEGPCRTQIAPPSASHARNPPRTRSDTDQTPTSPAES